MKIVAISFFALCFSLACREYTTLKKQPSTTQETTQNGFVFDNNFAPNVNVSYPHTTLTLPDNQTIAYANATDSNNDSMTYSWSLVSGGTASINEPTSSSTTITGLSAGDYVFKVTVTDSKGAASDALVKIKVKPQAVMSERSPASVSNYR